MKWDDGLGPSLSYPSPGHTIASELAKQFAALPDSGVGRCSLLAYLFDVSLGLAPSA